MTTSTKNRGMLPLGVYLLAFSLFAMGSAEFLLAGVLPNVAGDIDVSLATVGGLITAFAVGVVIGGPPFAVISLHWPRRTALVVTQIVFAVAIGTGVFIGTYPALLVSRFIAGLAYAGFFAVATVTAVGLVAPDRAGRASSVVMTGLSLSMILGGPIGTFIGYQMSWQAGFWLVVVLTIIGATAVAIAMPHTAPATEPSVRREVAELRQPRLWLIFLVAMLSTASYMITFNYLSELLLNTTGVPDSWIAAVLVLFGVGAYLGLMIGGRIADRRPYTALIIGAVGVAATSALIAVFTTEPTIVVPLVFVLGVFGFVLNPAIYARVFSLAGSAPTLAGATTVSAIQLGIGSVPVLAGIALGAGSPVTTLVWFGGALAVLTVLVTLAESAMSKSHVGNRVGDHNPTGDPLTGERI